LSITPLDGQQIVLDGAIVIDAGVVTGATSITSTAFVGDLTGDVTGNASGTALTVTQAAQTAITSVGILTALQVDNINIDGNTISSTAGTDLSITPLDGQQIVLDGAIVIDAGVVTGATSITSTAFVGDLTGDVTGDVTGAIQSPATARTATSDGTGDGTIAAGTSVVLVTGGSDANSIIILPAPVIGNIITLIETATVGYELRTSTPASIGINGGTGANAESAIAGAISYVKCVCVSSTSWICSQYDADGDESKVVAAAV
jgi:hypothetical protein